MAIGQQENRTVGGLEFDVATLTGIIATHAAFVDTLDTATDDTYADLASTSDGAGTGATFTVVVAGNAVDTVTMTAPGTGYEAGDTIVIDFSLIAGASSGTVASTVATVVGEVDTVTVTDGGTNWVTGDVVSADELTTDGSGSGLAGTVTASALNNDTPETGGVISAVTVTAGGTGYAVADSQVYSGVETGPAGPRYFDHDQYELGGDTQEYTTTDDSYPKSTYTPDPRTETLDLGTNVGDPSNAADKGQRFDDNSPTIKIVTKADLPQWQVQQRDIDGGAITVFAEPGTVDRNGKLVGQTLRAEDLVDQARCEAAGFTWVANAPTGDADQGDYGYCQNPAGTAHADAATVNALDPANFDLQFECTNAGFHWEAKAAGGLVVGYTTVGTTPTSAFVVTDGGSGYSVGDAITTDDNDVVITVTAVTPTNIAGYGGAVTAFEYTSGDSSTNGGVATGVKDVAGKCLQNTVASTFSLANFAYGTTSSAKDYAKTMCLQYGFQWVEYDSNGAQSFTCVADSDPTGLTQAQCADAGHIWIAGTCYDAADFGDGHNREASTQQDPTDAPK